MNANSCRLLFKHLQFSCLCWRLVSRNPLGFQDLIASVRIRTFWRFVILWKILDSVKVLFLKILHSKQFTVSMSSWNFLSVSIEIGFFWRILNRNSLDVEDFVSPNTWRFSNWLSICVFSTCRWQARLAWSGPCGADDWSAISWENRSGLWIHLLLLKFGVSSCGAEDCSAICFENRSELWIYVLWFAIWCVRHERVHELWLKLYLSCVRKTEMQSSPFTSCQLLKTMLFLKIREPNHMRVSIFTWRVLMRMRLQFGAFAEQKPIRDSRIRWRVPSYAIQNSKFVNRNTW